MLLINYIFVVGEIFVIEICILIIDLIFNYKLKIWINLYLVIRNVNLFFKGMIFIFVIKKWLELNDWVGFM